MINVKFKSPTPAELMRSVSLQIEKSIVSKANEAARRHGGVSVRFKRNSDGSLSSVEFEGSPAAIAAAKLTLQRNATP